MQSESRAMLKELSWRCNFNFMALSTTRVHVYENGIFHATNMLIHNRKNLASTSPGFSFGNQKKLHLGIEYNVPELSTQSTPVPKEIQIYADTLKSQQIN